MKKEKVVKLKTPLSLNENPNNSKWIWDYYYVMLV